MRFVPGNKQSISHRQRRSMVRCKIIKVVHTPGQSGADMSHDFSLKVLFRLEFVERKGFPQSACFGGDTRCQDFDFFLAVAGGGACVVTRTDGDAGRGKSMDTHDGDGDDEAIDLKINVWICGSIGAKITGFLASGEDEIGGCTAEMD